MGLYFGISCLRQDWHGIYLGTNVGLRSDVSGLHGGMVEAVHDLPELGAFSELEQQAGLSHCKTWTEEAVCHTLHQDLDDFNLGAIYSQLLFDAEEPKAVGICHPYGLSAVARRVLPAFVDAKPIQLRYRTEPDIEHRDTRRDVRICAIETPFAACLTLVDRGELQLPATIFVISNAALGIELTALRLLARSRDLGMEVLHHSQLEKLKAMKGFHVQSDNEARKSAKRGSLDFAVRIALEEKRKRRAGITVVSVDSETQPVAEFLSEQIAGSLTRQLDEQDLAAGAARYTAMCVEQDQSEFEFQKLTCRLVAPNPIGICGRNESNEFFWCPVTEAGQRLNTKRALKFTVGSMPRRVVFAEHLDKARAPGSWAVEADVEHLRWHSQVSIDPLANGEPTSIEIEIRGSTGCLEYGWSDPFVRAAFTSGETPAALLSK